LDADAWFKSVKATLTAGFTDITNIEVITTVADEVSLIDPNISKMHKLKDINLKKMSYYARTTMQLDGDNFTILPSGPNGEKVKDVQKIHEDHVSTAVLNWNRMAKVAFTGVLVVATLVGVPKDELKDAFELVEKFGLVSKS